MSDNKVQIDFNIEESLLFELMLEAHKKELTLSQLMQNILVKFISQSQRPTESE